MSKKFIIFAAEFAALVIAILVAGLALCGCSVVRTVTTTASTYKSGDTTTTIVTKTIESYDAKKDGAL